MKSAIPACLLALLLAGCDIFKVAPQPFPVWTPIPTRTPGVVTATPLILVPTMTASPAATETATSAAITPQVVDTFTPESTATATLTPAPAVAVQVEILGCNTGIDLAHGMGEVTNAYVTLRNTGTQDLPNTCALLRAADEGREHPDKTRCVENLPSGYQVTLKLTVDSAYRQDTVIQVDASSDSILLMRVDRPSCTDLDIVGSIPGDIGVIKPIEP